MPENEGVPQFHTAEFEQQPAQDTCCVCHQPIAGSYYRIAGRMACYTCAQQMMERKPVDTHAAYSRAVLYGLGAAFLGLALYSAVGILLHLEIGFVSLAVGWLVGKAMMMGSGNIGGRRYQWAAVLLTYAAVSISAVPITIAQYSSAKHEAKKAAAVMMPQAAPQADTTNTPSAPDAQNGAAAVPQSGEEPNAAPETTHYGVGKVLLVLLAAGLASPFLSLTGNFASGAIGLVILFVGVQIAWKMTAGMRLPAIEGPF